VTVSANPFAGLALNSPAVSPVRAREIAADLFGVDGAVSELPSHQERNFLVDSTSGRYVLKIANRVFSAQELDLQNTAMDRLGARVAFDVPRVVAALDGRTVVEAGDDQARLLTYVEGRPLQSFSHLAAPVLRSVGALGAETALALAGLDHPAADRLLQWDLQRAPEVVAALAPQLADANRAARAKEVMARAQQILEPLRPKLPTQVIHADICDWNVLCARDRSGRPSPTGLIDFGDVVRSYRVAELVAAATSCLSHSPDAPVQTVREVALAFHERCPLVEWEVEAIWPLVLARAATVAVSTAQQAQVEAANTYVADAVATEWQTLEAAATVPPALGREALRLACGFGPSAAARKGADALRRLARTCEPMLASPGRPVPLDLTVQNPDLRVGHAPVQVTEGDVAVGRWGEARLVHAVPDRAGEPATVHLGVDVFTAPGTAVSVPADGRVLRVDEREATIDLAGVLLRVAKLDPSVLPGQRLRAGEQIGVVAAAAQHYPLPPHLHVQAALEDSPSLPGLAQPTLRRAWLTLCPDPGPLLGVDAAAPTPEDIDLLEQRHAHVASPQAHYYERPPVIERGWRQHLYDGDGRAYLDMVNNVAVVGHSHPAVTRAASRQLRLLNTNSRFLYGAMPAFARRLAALVPEPLEVAFLVNSGSEANELALRLIRETTGTRDVLCFEGSYHGWTAATFEVSTSLAENPTERATRPPWVHPLPAPNTFRGPHRGDDAAALYLADAERVLDGLAGEARSAAGLIAEPILGVQGGLVPPAGFTRRLVELVRARGGLFVADEVQVGFGRLGHCFWAFEHQGVVPDVVTIAKATGNGFPLGAVLTRRDLANEFGRSGSWFSSAGGSPVSCAVGLAVLDAIEGERLQENARDVGDHLRRRLLQLAECRELVGAVHGLGLYLGVELVRDRETLEPATEETYAVCERMRELGVVVQPTGEHENILKVKPPLVITRASADFFVDQLDRVLTEDW